MVKRRSIRAGVGEHMEMVSIPTDVEQEELCPENLTPVSSYNWLPGRMIAVPEPRTLPIRIKADHGVTYTNENKARCSKYPLEPLFRSIYFLEPEFDPNSIDVVTDRRNLRELLKIVRGKSVRDFRIDLELVGETLLFTTWELEKGRTYIHNSKGYGHEFEKALGTYPGSLRLSTGHYRVIRYSLAGMQILLRFEADGYLPSIDVTRTPSSKPVVKQRQSANATFPSESSQMESPSIQSNLRVTSLGHEVPHNALVELKTRNEKRWLATNEVIDQLWFGEVRHLKIGYHNKGTVTRIDHRNFCENGEFDRFGRDKGQELRKMIHVIDNIRRIMKEYKIVEAVLMYEESLHLYRKDSVTHSLPQDLLSKWNLTPRSE